MEERFENITLIQHSKMKTIKKKFTTFSNTSLLNLNKGDLNTIAALFTGHGPREYKQNGYRYANFFSGYIEKPEHIIYNCVASTLGTT